MITKSHGIENINKGRKGNKEPNGNSKMEKYNNQNKKNHWTQQ